MNNVVVYAYISCCMCIVFLTGLHIRANYILLRNAVPKLNKQVLNARALILLLMDEPYSSFQNPLVLSGCWGTCIYVTIYYTCAPTKFG